MDTLLGKRRSGAMSAVKAARTAPSGGRAVTIILVGDSGVGKTRLINSLCDGVLRASTVRGAPLDRDEFHAHLSDLAVFEERIVDTIVNGTSVRCRLWDTSSAPDDRLRTLCYSSVDAVLFCYAVDRPNSLENIFYQWWPEMLQYFNKSISENDYNKQQSEGKSNTNSTLPAVMLVGCRSDCRYLVWRRSMDVEVRYFNDDDDYDDKKLPMLSLIVDQASVQRIASRIGAITCVECSAATGDQLSELLFYMAQCALRNKMKRKRNCLQRWLNNCLVNLRHVRACWNT